MFKKILLNKQLSRLKSPETIIVGAFKIAKNSRRRWISRSRFDNARRWYAALCSKPQDSKSQRKSMFAMKFRYSKFRHSASEPKEKETNYPFVVRFLGRHVGLVRTVCARPRVEPRGVPNRANDLRLIIFGTYTFTLRNRGPKERWKRWRIDEHDEPSQFRRSVKPFESRISFVARQICGTVRLLRNEHRITRNRSRIGESYGEIFAPNRYS